MLQLKCYWCFYASMSISRLQKTQMVTIMWPEVVLKVNGVTHTYPISSVLRGFACGKRFNANRRNNKANKSCDMILYLYLNSPRKQH